MEEIMAIKKERALEIMKKFTGCEIYPASFTEAQDCFLAIIFLNRFAI